MENMKATLTALPAGEVPETLGLDGLLAGCWENLDGSDSAGMNGAKLLGRMERVRWNPPILFFVIERHGGTVNGSTRGELQHWEVDLDNWTARITKTGHRQLKPMAARHSIKQIAEEIAARILNGEEDHRLQRFDDGTVRVLASAIFPMGSGFRRTVEGRRKQLVQYVEQRLVENGWMSKGGNRFGR